MAYGAEVWTDSFPMMRAMDNCNRRHMKIRSLRAFLLGSLMAASQMHPASAAEKPAWPTTVHAHYSLRFQGLEVGDLKITSETSGKAYTLTGSSAVSVLFGTIKFSGSSNVSGTIDRGVPTPGAFAFNWRQNKKVGTVRIGYQGGAASDIAIVPPPKVKPDTVPLTANHMTGAFDPLSAILMMTKADGRQPCDRSVPIFDGRNRYNIVLSPKRTMRLPSQTGGDASDTGFVCRVVYQPIAGHRDNEDTRTYAANKDSEIVLRRIPGTEMLIPHSVTIPTSWGTGSMVTKKIEIVTDRKIALTN